MAEGSDAERETSALGCAALAGPGSPCRQGRSASPLVPKSPPHDANVTVYLCN